MKTEAKILDVELYHRNISDFFQPVQKLLRILKGVPNIPTGQCYTVPQQCMYKSLLGGNAFSPISDHENKKQKQKQKQKFLTQKNH